MSGVPKYQGRRVEIKGQGMPEAEVLRPNGEVLDPKPSQKIRNHSPDGFEWGYGGSGPAQLALALLLDYVCDETLPMDEDLRDAIRKEAAALDEEDEVGIHRFVVRYYQDFKRQYVAVWDASGNCPPSRSGVFCRPVPAGAALPPTLSRNQWAASQGGSRRKPLPARKERCMARKKRLEVGVEEEVWEQLKALSEEEERSMSQIANRMIRRGLKHYRPPATGEEDKTS